MRPRAVRARGQSQLLSTSDGKIESKEVSLEPYNVAVASSMKTNSTTTRIQQNNPAYPDFSMKFGEMEQIAPRFYREKKMARKARMVKLA